MCGFVGWANNKKSILEKKNILIKMTDTLSKRGPDATGYFDNSHLLLGHKRLSIIDVEKGIQPMIYKNYVIVYNGELYNTNEIRNRLILHGYTFDTECDTEVLLKGFIQYKEHILDLINGIYAFAIYDGDSIFLARDRLGVKPLFYSRKKRDFIFASEIKAILKSEIIKPIINKTSLQELLALGPSKSPGNGIFKDIKELKPGHFLTYRKNKITIKKYWDVWEETFKDTFDECKTKIRNLLTDSIRKQMVSDVGIATLLSGGLDSSIITGVCATEMKDTNPKLTTYSIDYEENNKYFKKNDFQVSEDKYFIDLMTKKFYTNHKYEVITQGEVANYLRNAVTARDMPGMADIDSSLLWFSKEIKKDFKVVLSGECADEIFGGYPWFYKEELLSRKGFPWISNLNERNNLLNKKLRRKLKLEKYAIKQYNKTIKEMPESHNEIEYKKLFYINMKWFMTTLLDRKDRMTMNSSLEARVPFADHRLVEYLWNVPWKYKFHKNQEKGLLREAFKDLLPNDIITRKKNPYPKTHHPKYTDIVCNLLSERLKNKDSIIYKIFNINEIQKLIETKGSSYQKPWFGQLMTGPQLIAYLYQFDIWAEEYNIILRI